MVLKLIGIRELLPAVRYGMHNAKFDSREPKYIGVVRPVLIWNNPEKRAVFGSVLKTW